MEELQAISWRDGSVGILDQTQLPNDLVLLNILDHHGIVSAIKRLSVRGAPAIGIAAAFGVVLAVWDADESDRTAFLEKANTAILDLKKSRPTAKNLFWALNEMRTTLTKNLNKPLNEIKLSLLKQAQYILKDDISRCKKIGKIGADLLPNRANVLTHCNAGALATGGYGTALGVLRAAKDMRKKIKVYVDETRPLLQGARLTAFELLEDDFDVTLICDSVAGSLMKQGLINSVVVGADRIASNGDVANKIGTYSVAVLARHHKIPFYVAAPLSTFDFELNTGFDIPIELRDDSEVKNFGNVATAPEDVQVFNPAFDVTPNELVTAIITEKGIAKSPYLDSLKLLRK
jgi:methylthioribose-1-phosphate isomerase